jgi:hypothetical protein
MTNTVNQGDESAIAPSNGIFLARLGAASYVIWALLHLLAAWSVYRLGRSVDPSMVQARLLQDAWNLACFSCAALGIAVTLNWRNDRFGYWINLGVISVADIGFIIFVLVPGYLPSWPGLLGPILWLVGLVLTMFGRVRTHSAA